MIESTDNGRAVGKDGEHMSREAMETVKRYYDETAEREWERLETHPFEFDLTTWMMDRYIQPGDTILDIGGGPGRYALHYARRGCPVTLVDLSPGNIRLARQKAEEPVPHLPRRQLSGTGDVGTRDLRSCVFDGAALSSAGGSRPDPQRGSRAGAS